jgi:hypothetical protein
MCQIRTAAGTTVLKLNALPGRAQKQRSAAETALLSIEPEK